MLRQLRFSVLLPLVAAPVSAQTITTLLLEGDAVPGGGTVSEILRLDVNSSGSWMATVDSDPGSSTSIVTLLDGVELYREGDPIVLPSPPFMGGLGPGFDLNDAGQHCAGVFLHPSSPGAQYALVHEGSAFLFEGSTVFAAGVPSGSTYGQFGETWAGRDDYFLVRAQIPSPSGPNNAALIQIEHDGGLGLLDQQLVVMTGSLLPGQTNAVQGLPSLSASHDMNRLHQFAMTVDLFGSTSSDTAIYVDDQLIAQEGSPSGVVAGQNWGDLTTARLDLNDHGQLAFHTRLANNDEVIVFDGRLIAQDGGAPPGITGGSAFFSFGSLAPVACSNTGDVAYIGSWLVPGFGNQTGLFVGDQLLVKAGALTGGLVFDSLELGADSFRMSDDGRYVIFQGQLAGGVDGLFLFDRGMRPIEYCAGDGLAEPFSGPVPCPCSNESIPGYREGCLNSQGHGAFIGVQGSLVAASGDTRFSLNQARPNQPGLLIQGSTALRIPFKDGVLCMGNPTERVEVVFTDANGFAQTSSDIAVEGGVAALDARGYQFWYRDPSISPCGTGSNFTQALAVLWQ